MSLTKIVSATCIVLGAALASGVVWAVDVVEADAASAWARPMLLGAHRGGKGEWPENTVLAFSEAATQYPDILLEGDLQLSKDGVVVVIHDRTVDRTTNGSGTVQELTLAQLKALDAGYHFSSDGGKTYPYRGTGITIPTLDEILQAMPKNRALFELKDGEGLVAKVVPLLRKHGAADRILIASFKPELMAAMREQMPEIATCFDRGGALALLSALRTGDWSAYEPTARMLSLPKRYIVQFKLTAEEFRKMQEKGVLIQVHTLNTPEEMDHFRAMGVDSILTDYPALLARCLTARNNQLEPRIKR
ncbi:MAG: glycerophosphodiester phosphodiesterase [Candidatus Hydrogenedentes bacterium]|nr:glycerophosphodiester phosphodiesterase [Candidatus Hydrogenedentota bacterium]